MTKSFATQAASFALALAVTFGAFSGVSHVAAHQRAAVENEAATVAMAESPVQTVVVIGHHLQKA